MLSFAPAAPARAPNPKNAEWTTFSSQQRTPKWRSRVGSRIEWSRAQKCGIKNSSTVFLSRASKKTSSFALGGLAARGRGAARSRHAVSGSPWGAAPGAPAAQRRARPGSRSARRRIFRSAAPLRRRFSLWPPRQESAHCSRAAAERPLRLSELRFVDVGGGRSRSAHSTAPPGTFHTPISTQMALRNARFLRATWS